MDASELVLVVRFPTAYKAHVTEGKLEPEEAERISNTMPGLFNFPGT